MKMILIIVIIIIMYHVMSWMTKTDWDVMHVVSQLM